MLTAHRWTTKPAEGVIQPTAEEMDAAHAASWAKYGPEINQAALKLYVADYARAYSTKNVPLGTMARYEAQASSSFSGAKQQWFNNLPKLPLAEVAGQPLIPIECMMQYALHVSPEGVYSRVQVNLSDESSYAHVPTNLHGLCVTADATSRLSPALLPAELYAKYILGTVPTYFAGRSQTYGVDERVLPYFDDFETVKAMLEHELKPLRHVRLLALHPVWHRGTSGERNEGPLGPGRVCESQGIGKEIGGGRFLVTDQISWLVMLEYTFGNAIRRTGYIILDPVDFRVNALYYCLYELKDWRDKDRDMHFHGSGLRPSLLEYAAGVGESAVLVHNPSAWGDRNHYGLQRIDVGQLQRRAQAPVGMTALQQFLQLSTRLPETLWNVLTALPPPERIFEYSAERPVPKPLKGLPDFRLYRNRRSNYLSIRWGEVDVAYTITHRTDLLRHLAPELTNEPTKGTAVNQFYGTTRRLGGYTHTSLRKLGVSQDDINTIVDAMVRVGFIALEQMPERYRKWYLRKAELDAYAEAPPEATPAPVDTPNTEPLIA